MQIPAISVSALLLVGMIVAAVNTDWRPIPEAATDMVESAQAQAVSGVSGAGSESGTTGIADLLIGEFVLPFEAVSLLLLAALIGGLALARSRGT